MLVLWLSKELNWPEEEEMQKLLTKFVAGFARQRKQGTGKNQNAEELLKACFSLATQVLSDALPVQIIEPA